MADMGRFERRTAAAKESRFVHVSTGRPEYYLPVMAELRALGKEVGFDPAQELGRVWKPEMFLQALTTSTTFFCNREELRTALRYVRGASPEALLAHVPMIISTRGAEGTVVMTGAGSWSVRPARPTGVVDPTGAGDAFRAGYYAGRYRGHGVLESVGYGNAAASYVLESPGALTNLPSWEQVADRAAELLAALPR
jgi:sugar/nucleoside kinase (ribokinase family)